MFFNNTNKKSAAKVIDAEPDPQLHHSHPTPDSPESRQRKRELSDEYFLLKNRIHTRLLDMVDLSMIDSLEPEVLKTQIRSLVTKILDTEERNAPLNMSERERLFSDIEDEVMGLGPLEPFLKDDTVADILVNTHNQIYVERFGKLELSESTFKDDAHLMRIIDKIVSSVGRRIDESSPMVDARLADGSRVNVIIPPLALDGPVMSIRRFGKDPLKMDDLIMLRAFTQGIGEIMKGIVRSELNVVISGGTGSGKTTLLNCLSQFIPATDRIITIEDAAELQLKQEHVVRLETRPPNIEGKGEVTARELVRNSLRMRPDRIIVGEVRGSESFDMLQAMNTGHDGSLTTIHANTPRDALMRIESMVSMANLDIPIEFMRRFIASAIHIIIQVSRYSDGTRKVNSIQEITGMEGNVITTQEIFSFNPTGVDENGKVKGYFRFNGVRPQFVDKFHQVGIEVDREIFNPDKIVEV
ncbi:CpaF family protein [Desulfohalobium retbaense]|uniref:Type II secretion system protein E n=1 Tax=Desulfohalobium retbaense (strain ATCC 49708 / DSM 5692 / JCM 16813 / HR100) TaxID=485915 RepID=C8X1M7_DESRD|nr:CpaF family protein [Desulfohalobium retbaense]ACV68449.1 type II secretion system protein E [Desulfohalobium retbaense DSM 5692]